MGKVPVRIIQLSDIHLFADKQSALLGVKTHESFKAVTDLLKNEKIDMIILSGDLSQDGSEKSYVEIANILKPFHIPVYILPGNHDNVNMMSHVYPRANIYTQKHILLKNWQLILLNSQKPGSVAGYLDDNEIKYMEQCLKKEPANHAIVFFHHQPLLINCAWLDKIGVTNAEQFWKVASTFPKLSAVVFGHIHQVLETKINHVQCISAPSTCFQFKPAQDEFGLQNIPPGYRWIELYDDGQIKTGVVRTEKYIGVYEPNSKGYT